MYGSRASDCDRHGCHHQHHGCATQHSSLGHRFFDTPCTLDHSCRFVLTRHMEAQDFSDFFEHINPDAPEILSMPVITTSLAIHLEGQLQGAYRSWRAFFSDLPSPLPGTFMHPCNTCFLLCTCVMFYASMLYTFSLVYLCMMFYIRIHK